MDMYDVLLTSEERKIREEVREFVKGVDPEMIRKMEREEVKFPKEFIREVAERDLLGLRFPKEYGGRGTTWMAELSAIEEVGVLGFTLACLYSLASIIGEPNLLFWVKGT